MDTFHFLGDCQESINLYIYKRTLYVLSSKIGFSYSVSDHSFLETVTVFEDAHLLLKKCQHHHHPLLRDLHCLLAGFQAPGYYLVEASLHQHPDV